MRNKGGILSVSYASLILPTLGLFWLVNKAVFSSGFYPKIVFLPAGSLGATVFSGTVSDAFCPLLVEGFSIVMISNFVAQNFSQLYVKPADEELGS